MKLSLVFENTDDITPEELNPDIIQIQVCGIFNRVNYTGDGVDVFENGSCKLIEKSIPRQLSKNGENLAEAGSGIGAAGRWYTIVRYVATFFIQVSMNKLLSGM
jgi:hypothetical protein